MTCIMAVSCGDRAIMVADSAVCVDTLQIETHQPKIRKWGDSILVGVSGDAAVADRLLLTDLSNCSLDEPWEWLVQTGVHRLKKVVPPDSEFSILLAVGGRLFCVGSDWGVLTPARYYAIGVADTFALGALAFAFGPGFSAAMIVDGRLMSVRTVVESHVSGVAGPWTILISDPV